MPLFYPLKSGGVIFFPGRRLRSPDHFGLPLQQLPRGAERHLLPPLPRALPAPQRGDPSAGRGQRFAQGVGDPLPPGAVWEMRVLPFHVGIAPQRGFLEDQIPFGTPGQVPCKWGERVSHSEIKPLKVTTWTTSGTFRYHSKSKYPCVVILLSWSTAQRIKGQPCDSLWLDKSQHLEYGRQCELCALIRSPAPPLPP